MGWLKVDGKPHPAKYLAAILKQTIQGRTVHQFSSRILHISVRTESVDQDQTVQTALSDVGFTLFDNRGDRFFSQK